jgi:hypothetical protein
MLLALAMFCACSLSAEQADEKTQSELKAMAASVITSLENGDCSKVPELFDAKVKAGLTPDALLGVWKGLQDKLGKYKNHGDPGYSVDHGGDRVNILCRFESDSLNLVLFFDQEKKINGFWFWPMGK